MKWLDDYDRTAFNADDFEEKFRRWADYWGFTHSTYEAERFRHIASMLPDGAGTVLDYGCHEGHLLRALSGEDRVLRGLERSQVAAARAQSSGLDVRVTPGARGNLALWSDQPDIIILSHVLCSPGLWLPEIAHLLETFRGRWFLIADGPDVPNVTTVSGWLQSTGFRLIEEQDMAAALEHWHVFDAEGEVWRTLPEPRERSGSKLSLWEKPC